MSTATTDQAEYWNGPAGQRWVHEQDTLDAMLRPYSRALMQAAALPAGAKIVDVGCGCGDTSLALAEVVGPEGVVLGLDVSAPMLERAKARGKGKRGLSFQLGDAATFRLDPGRYDWLFSRFGVMFFPEPMAAFTNLRRGLRAEGRAAFVCWKPLADNPWAKEPFDAVANALGRPEPPPPDAPGPFSFGDAARVHRILEGAGFSGVALQAFDTENTFGGGSDDESAAELARLGPVSRLLAGEDEAAHRLAIEAIKPLLAGRRNARGRVAFPAAAWIVTAFSSP
jgi:SAM-dependent methyltransferase